MTKTFSSRTCYSCFYFHDIGAVRLLSIFSEPELSVDISAAFGFWLLGFIWNL